MNGSSPRRALVRSAVAGCLAPAVVLLGAAPAAAAPRCDDLTPTTRMCRTTGHAAITTSPDPARTDPGTGWGYGGIGRGLEAGGLWFRS